MFEYHNRNEHPEDNNNEHLNNLKDPIVEVNLSLRLLKFVPAFRRQKINPIPSIINFIAFILFVFLIIIELSL